MVKSAKFVVSNLEQSSTILSEWLSNNYMKANTVKSLLLLSCNSRTTATIENNYIELEDEQVLLSITIDSNLTFENHVNSICPGNALERIASYRNYEEQA